MTDAKQPEALRLARQLSDLAEQDASEWPANMNWIILATSAEMKGQAARIAELEAENRALKDQLEAIGAGGVTGLRSEIKPHQIRELVNTLRDIAVEHHARQSLRDRISTAVGAAIAQEGGK